jgi:NADP-dependent aldehyde dehydrogenase
VFAEMSSVNPCSCAGALQHDAENIAQGFVTSLTLGAGQFCTNRVCSRCERRPRPVHRSRRRRAVELHRADDADPGIHSAYEDAVGWLGSAQGVHAQGKGQDATGPNQARGALFVTDGDTFKRNPRLAMEVFGPCAMLVRVDEPESLFEMIDALDGQLTATVHLRETDFALASRLLPALEHKVGRIIANGTHGVEVAHAMVHGGPFPATSDSRTTSVGSLAIERFLRPVCYQDVPGALLPAALRDGDGRFERLVDGVRVGPDAERGS